ncbi:hypothetical protein [Rosistilla oblonga]|uniref:hypothetical protein n=1 Tax=Rosistilla oblonga TaxID=2527990 RepID=UPI003A9715CE
MRQAKESGRPRATDSVFQLIRKKSLRSKPRCDGSSPEVRGGNQTLVSHEAIAGHSFDVSPSQQLCPTGCDWQHA